MKAFISPASLPFLLPTHALYIPTLESRCSSGNWGCGGDCKKQGTIWFWEVRNLMCVLMGFQSFFSQVLCVREKLIWGESLGAGNWLCIKQHCLAVLLINLLSGSWVLTTCSISTWLGLVAFAVSLSALPAAVSCIISCWILPEVKYDLSLRRSRGWQAACVPWLYSKRHIHNVPSGSAPPGPGTT